MDSEGFDPGSGSQKARISVVRPALLARLSGCKFIGKRHPGWSSLSLLDPGLISTIPSGITNRNAVIESLKALALSVGTFARSDGGQRKKGGKSWGLTLQPYAAASLTLKCHEDGDLARHFTYVMNDFLTPNPAASFSNGHFHFTDYADQVAVGIHNGKANYLFADGHVEILSREEICARLRLDRVSVGDSRAIQCLVDRAVRFSVAPSAG